MTWAVEQTEPVTEVLAERLEAWRVELVGTTFKNPLTDLHTALNRLRAASSVIEWTAKLP